MQPSRDHYPHDRKGGGLVVFFINFWFNGSNAISFQNHFYPRIFLIQFGLTLSHARAVGWKRLEDTSLAFPTHV